MFSEIYADFHSTYEHLAVDRAIVLFKEELLSSRTFLRNINGIDSQTVHHE
jgi:hypothetical protein